MNENKWQTTKQAGVPCATCGKIGSCKVSPDGIAFLCWRDGGAIHQTKPHAPQTGNGYAGKAPRKPVAATDPDRLDVDAAKIESEAAEQRERAQSASNKARREKPSSFEFASDFD